MTKARRMRQTIRNSQNEPGMCPGINSFTFWRLTSAAQIERRGQRPAGSASIRSSNLAALPGFRPASNAASPKGGTCATRALARLRRMRRTNRNSQNEPGMCPGINEIENRGGKGRRVQGAMSFRARFLAALGMTGPDFLSCLESTGWPDASFSRVLDRRQMPQVRKAGPALRTVTVIMTAGTKTNFRNAGASRRVFPE